jgi:hypothetical protein
MINGGHQHQRILPKIFGLEDFPRELKTYLFAPLRLNEENNIRLPPW